MAFALNLSAFTTPTEVGALTADILTTCVRCAVEEQRHSPDGATTHAVTAVDGDRDGDRDG